MGAEMLISALAIDAGRVPDFGAARDAIEELRSEQIEVPEEFWDLDPDNEEDLAAIREQLHSSLAELDSALGRSRELTWLALRGICVYLTGGLSSGDAPTELFADFTRLQAAPVILSAAGFEVI